jgi:hypothetical protein
MSGFNNNLDPMEKNKEERAGSSKKKIEEQGGVVFGF